LIYHPQRWEEAKSVSRILIKPAQQKTKFLLSESHHTVSGFRHLRSGSGFTGEEGESTADENQRGRLQTGAADSHGDFARSLC